MLSSTRGRGFGNLGHRHGDQDHGRRDRDRCLAGNNEDSANQNVAKLPRACHRCGGIGHFARDCPINQGQSNSEFRNRNTCRTQEASTSRSNANNHGPRSRPPVFSFTRLHGFLSEESGNVIMTIGRNIPEWCKVMDSIGNKTPEYFVVIVHILAKKVCQMENNLLPSRIEILTSTFKENFTKQLRQLYSSMCIYKIERVREGVEIDQSRLGILESSHIIFAFLTFHCPHLASDQVPALVTSALGVLSVLVGGTLEETAKISELQESFKKLMDDVNKFTERKRMQESICKRRMRGYKVTEHEEHLLHSLPAPDNFRLDIPIVPTIQELLSTEPTFLRTNIQSGRYIDSEHYLDVHFRLYREDFVNPLKKGIQDFIKNRLDYLSRKKKTPLGNVKIYSDVTIQDITLNRDAMIYSIQLPATLFRKIKWEKSKRLLYGSLLVLTADLFKTAYFAMVANRDTSKLAKEGIIGVTWVKEGEIPNFDQTFLMVECEVYFEAYRHTLEKLKKLNLENFPMKKFIVEACNVVGPPKYLECLEPLNEQQSFHVGNLEISPLVLPWPSVEELGLPFDDNQFNAYQAAVTNEFSIIQGPPGTGKTYLGLKIAETFLKNMNIWRIEDKGPILVVCYTNHALDQFLEGVLEILNRLYPNDSKTPDLIRVGSRSKNDTLEPFNLFNKKKTAKQLGTLPIEYIFSESDAAHIVRTLEDRRTSLIAEACGLGDLKGLVQFKSLTCLSELKEDVSEEIISFLENPVWLGLKDRILTYQNFSPHGLIYKWFKKLLPQMPANVVSFQVRNTGNIDSNNENGIEDHDEEDYDQDELMAHRLEENVEYEDEIKFEMSKHKGAKITYIEDYSISGCEGFIRYGHNRLITLRQLIDESKNARLGEKLRMELESLPHELLETENVLKFLRFLFRLYKEGRLDLPDMSHYCQKELNINTSPVNRLTLAQKWSIYFAVIEKARKAAVRAISALNVSLIAAQKKLDQIRRYGDGLVLRQTKVVGMTTTGAAKYHDFLEIMESKIVIVEEAAEVLESHIVTCITEHCQHLILIGDHQQLRPSTTVYELSKKYFLDISLFERMLNNNLNCYGLKVQHRMRPEIADLVVGTIYPELINAPNVLGYPNVLGMHSNLFFIDHQEHEKSEADSLSKSNTFEASLLTKLCWYLILQGYLPSEITILTTYTGQMFLLKKEIGKMSECKGVRVSVVDNFQGEENKIILLSLVRSNEENNIGFLKTDNRICVAISRAMHGLYICGNMTNLAAKSETWKQILEKLVKRQEIGNELKLVCQFHQTLLEVRNSTDFDTKSPEGGCTLICDSLLECTHICKRICHATDREHEGHFRCLEPCLKFCENTHPCTARCSSKCPPCDVILEKTLPCQHSLSMRCHEDPAEVECLVFVEKERPCGHPDQFACYIDVTTVKCPVKVTKSLECGHQKLTQCYVDVAKIICKEEVTKILEPCGHEQIAKCNEQPHNIKCETEVEIELPDCKHKNFVKCKDSNGTTLHCQVKCTTRLECGHQCVNTCHPLSDPDHINYECRKDCARECENGHSCPVQHQCHEKCPPCKIQILKTLGCGVHKRMMLCGAPVTTVQCNNSCERTVPLCNHKCKKKCFEPCEPCQEIVTKKATCEHDLPTRCSEPALAARCQTLVKAKKRSLCGHETMVPCGRNNSLTPTEILNYCKHPCGFKFQPVDDNDKGCDHTCKGTCAACQRGCLHLKCQEKCGKMLICGHICDAPCASDCPPCRKPCESSCEHSVCRATCGQPCTSCKEKCNWTCPHKRCTRRCGQSCNREPCDEPCPERLKCSHPCVGFCGEPCPPLCRICDKEELTSFQLFGIEEEDDARFVYLVDCKHTIEADGLNRYMTTEIVKGEIGVKKCPRCNTPIRQSKRFGNILRNRLTDIMAVKKKIYGSGKTEPLQEALVKDVQDCVGSMEVMKGILPEMKAYFFNKLVNRIVSNGKNRTTIKYKCIAYGEIRSLEWIWKHIKDVNLMCTESKDLIAEVDFKSLKTKSKGLLSELLKRKLPLTTTEMENFETEFDRHYDICEVYKRKNFPGFIEGHKVATPLYNKALDVVLCVTPYSESKKKKLRQTLEELDNSLKTGLQITERERRGIIVALGMGEGRWYKCPAGHYYVIGECGGADEETNCHECGARIGGGHHRVVSGNKFAPEVDGATRPLWPQ